MIRAVALALLALLAACYRAPPPPPPPTHVALWEIANDAGVHGWIMGTVHALPRGTLWRRPAIDAALARADRLVLEIGQPLDAQVAGAALGRLGFTAGLPPPTMRLPAAQRATLAGVYRQLGLDDARFAGEETWAVAMQIAAIAGEKAGMDPASGVEPELRRLIGTRPVEGLETIDAQFGAFDGLPERAQVVLLADVAREVADGKDDDRDMLALWLKGDDQGMAREASTGFLAEPAIRTALLTARNRAWANEIDAMLKTGARPFIAVGAAHVVGTDGLPVLLGARGWTVRRVE